MAITETLIKEMLQAWVAAEIAVIAGRSYKIGSRELTRVDIGDIRAAQTYWETRLNRLNSGGPRVMRVTPRDL